MHLGTWSKLVTLSLQNPLAPPIVTLQKYHQMKWSIRSQCNVNQLLQYSMHTYDIMPLHFGLLKHQSHIAYALCQHNNIALAICLFRSLIYAIGISPKSRIQQHIFSEQAKLSSILNKNPLSWFSRFNKRHIKTRRRK